MEKKWMLAASIAVGSALLAAVAFDLLKQPKKVPPSSATVQELRRLILTINEELQAKIPQGEMIEGSSTQVQRIQDALSDAASKTDPDQAKAIHAMERLIGSMKLRVASYEHAYAEFTDKGGLQPKTLTTPDLIAERLRLVDSLETANKGLLKFMQEAETELRTELANSDVSPMIAERVAEGIKRGFVTDAGVEARNNASKLSAAMTGYLTLLKAEWGYWRVSERGGVIFQNPQTADAFDRYAKEINTTTDAGLEIAKRALTAQKKDLKR